MTAGASFLLASDVAFGVVFGVFVLALLVLAILAIRWGVRRDRPGREAWRQQLLNQPEGVPASGVDDRGPVEDERNAEQS